MEIAGTPLFTFIGLVLTFVSFVFDIVGFAAPYWYKHDQFDSNGGLWRIVVSAWQKAVQAMEVLGFVCLLAASVVVILKVFVMKDKPMLKMVAVGCLAAAALFILIGVGVFAAKSPETITDNLHFAFAFVIVAAVGAIAAAAMFGLDK